MRRLYIGIDPTTATVPPPATAPAAASPAPAAAPTPVPATPAAAAPAAVGGFFDTTLGKVYSLGSLLSGPVLAYHGYKRHDESILWGLGWWLAPLPWPIMMGIAVAQSVKDGKWRGFGQPIRK